ncbi:GNAT family N-acetyltransferase [Ruegeria sediminis]|nr:GNAT family N-acetyltransferase [Ruegeria sediminis]
MAERELVVAPAGGEGEMEAVRQLCRDYRRLLRERWPDVPAFLDRYYNAATFEDLLRRLPELHRPPDGAIFVARVGGKVVGCAMTHRVGPGDCEIKRVFVGDAARGLGAGAALFRAAMAQARRDGYSRMVLDTTTRLTEAIGLYRKLGFHEIAPFYDPPADLAEHLMFFGRDL